MIWQQIKDFCNSLDEGQLKQKVRIFDKTDMEPITTEIVSCETTNEEHYQHIYSGVEMVTKKDILEQQENINDFQIVLRKYDPYLAAE